MPNGEAIKSFYPSHDYYRKMSAKELVRQVAREALEAWFDDMRRANAKAQEFMRDLYAGKKSVQCGTCGRILQLRDDKLRCPECVKELDSIEYIDDYTQGRFIKTVVNVKERTYTLMENVP